jgi:hypothetical protein
VRQYIQVWWKINNKWLETVMWILLRKQNINVPTNWACIIFKLIITTNAILQNYEVIFGKTNTKLICFNLHLATWNSVFVYFSKISRADSSFVKVRQQYRTLYMKTYTCLWQYLAEFFLEWEIFQIKVVEKIKIHILCSVSYFRK